MKVFECKIIKLSVFLGVIFLFGQTGLSQQQKCGEQFFFSDILSKYTARRTSSPEPVNKVLIREIPKRKIMFVLNEMNEKTLRDAGANDSIIKLIRENVLPEAVEANALYEKYLNNYQSNDIESLEAALEAAKEFVSKFEKNEPFTEQVKYFKDAISTLEKAVNYI